jgi:nucleotide-binding universal stress UspA family protein
MEVNPMGKRILVAFDDSDNAMRAVEFVAQFFTPEHEITLFSVLPDTATLCEMYSPELTPYFLSQRDAFCSIEDKKKDLVEKAIKEGKELLRKVGFEEKNITIKLETQKKGVAKDIINEANSGYDTVILGRRGLSGIKEFILGSVSQKVLHSAKNVSVLLVD